jgi:hypothetical protein
LPAAIHGATRNTAVIASAAKQSMQQQERMDCFAEFIIGRRFAPTRWLAMTTGYDSAISPRVSREVCHRCSALSNQRARGMPGAQCARSRACSVESTRVSHHGHTGITRHPRAMVYGLFRALPGDRLSCHRHRQYRFRRLDTSVGVSGPHVFAVRVQRSRQKHRPRPPHPAPRS